MHKFPYPLVSCTNPITRDVQLALEIDGRTIANITRVAGGRAEVDPVEHYGLSEADVAEFHRLNKVLEQATEAMLNAGCATIQDAIGVESGDVAGMFFSGSEARTKAAEALASYLVCEYQWAHQAEF